ncbi:SNARE associated Golgi protein [uncultured archaeon]|nr:SNARE associated Golgi protein [uncultured archaeon]
MFEAVGLVGMMLIEWFVVFVANIVPAMMPPTWAILSFFYITYPQNIIILVILGVTASTTGRFALAKLSGYVTERFASSKKRHEFEAINQKLRGKPIEKFIFTFIYALSPLPSNALFIAFGATKTRMREVLGGFFAGRVISYLFLVFTTQKIFSSFESTILGSASTLTIAIEIVGVVIVIAFFFVDWNKIIAFGTAESKQLEHKWPSKKR